MSLVERARSIYAALAAAPEGLTKGQLRHATGLSVSHFDRALAECMHRSATAPERPAVVGWLPDAGRYLIARTPAEAEGIIEVFRKPGAHSGVYETLQRAYVRLYGAKAGASVLLFDKPAEALLEKPQPVAGGRAAPKPEVTPNTQMSQVLEHLEAGKSLTPLEALDLYGSLRLGAIIYDLRKLGYPVDSELVTVGRNKRVARYSLKQKELVAR